MPPEPEVDQRAVARGTGRRVLPKWTYTGVAASRPHQQDGTLRQLGDESLNLSISKEIERHSDISLT